MIFRPPKSLDNAKPVSLHRWFSSNLKAPVLWMFVVLVSGLMVWSVRAFNRVGIEQSAAINQLADSLTFAVNQHDRTFAEHLLASHLSRGDVTSVAICKGSDVIMSLPGPGATCAPQRGLFSSVLSSKIKGSDHLVAVSSFSRQTIVNIAVALLGLCSLALGFVTALVSRLSRRFTRDLIEPITANLKLSALSAPELNFTTPVGELQLLYEAHKTALAETRRLTEENAVQSRNAAMAFLVQTVAHDVRKPFSRVLAGLNVLEGESNRSGDIQGIRGRIVELKSAVESETAGVECMLTDIMDYGGETIADPVSVSMSRILRELTEQYESRILAKSIQVNLQCSEECLVDGNPRKLQRLFENLVENALDAMPVGAMLELKAAIVEDRVQVAIRNTGSVIPDVVMQRLFQPFVTSGKLGGTGLGLAIVARIAEQHRGKIWCDSSPEAGTCFTLELPVGKLAPQSTHKLGAGVAVEPVAKAEQAHAAELPDLPLRVALIEDDVWVAEDWEGADGMKVTAYPSPKEFLALLNQGPDALNNFDAIVTDYFFDSDEEEGPALSGSDILARVRELSTRIPILLASNVGDSVEVGGFTASIGKRPLALAQMRALMG